MAAVVPWARDFEKLNYEGRRLFSEFLGTFLLVVAAAGGDVIDARTVGGIGRVASVTAPGLTVAAVILFMGAVSGAHLNPVVSVGFALRHDFAWRRLPGYVVAQTAGAGAACLVLRATFGTADGLGGTHPGPGFSPTQAFVIEVILTLGLVSTVLGTASTAQNVGPLSALAVGAFIVLAGLWASPVSGASMNPARSIGPLLAGAPGWSTLWIYLAGPALGMALAVLAAQILRGPGGGESGSRAAQGTLTPATRYAGRPRRSRRSVGDGFVMARDDDRRNGRLRDDLGAGRPEREPTPHPDAPCADE